MTAAFEHLRTRLAEVSDLSKAAAILKWDQQTMMPPRGAAVRAEQLATIGRIAHERFTDPEVGRLLDGLASFEEEHDHDSFEASLIRVARRDWEKERKVPSELRAAMTRSSALAFPVWADARERNDLAAFLPVLRESLELSRRYVECFDDYDEPFDVLLDDFEPGMKTAAVREMFGYLKEQQTLLVREVSDAQPVPDPLAGTFPLELQRQFELEVATRLGFDDQVWRIDPTIHPFASGGGTQDIRITTRRFERSLEGLFATMHEFGHGLYERQVDVALERTPLAAGASLGLHESQSRMWENLVGRSLPFWRYFFPRLAEVYPEALGGYDVERWYRQINAVAPSLIRVDADEATYNLHIILRFEIEQELLSGSLPVERLAEEWNRRVWEYLGVEVHDDAHGVLQDVHWAAGLLGYFATYALGNLMSAQLWEKVLEDMPAIHDDFEQGEFGPLREWLRDNVHQHGRKLTPPELLERVVGTPKIEPEPYLRYLRAKLDDVYGIAVGSS